MPSLPPYIDLSGSKPPEDFYVCLIDDLNGLEAWRASPQAHDHRIPSSNWCGMTCLRMIMLLEDVPAPSLDDLFKEACVQGVYHWREDGTGWEGARHQQLAAFISSHGFPARFKTGADEGVLARALMDGHYAILRVGPDIRYPTYDEPSKKIGHVVLAHAYETMPDGSRVFRIHNSAGFATLESQIDFPVSSRRLAQVFSGDVTLVRSRYARVDP